MTFLSIEYPITREIHWKRINSLSYAGAFIAVVFLTVLNVALVGYETTNIFRDDFNATQDLWFYPFLPYGRPKPGTLCEPYLLTVSDQFRTEGGDLDWTIRSISGAANNSNSGLAYTGAALTGCDVSEIIISLDRTSEFIVILECPGIDGVSLQASAPLTAFMPTGANILDHLLLQGSDTHNTKRDLLKSILQDASGSALADENSTFSSIAIHAPLQTPCPSRMAQMLCGRSAPGFNLTIIAGDPHPPGNTMTVDIGSLPPSAGPMWNLLQTIYAIARVDIAIDSPNNFLLHKEALPLILTKQTTPEKDKPPVESPLYLNLEKKTYPLFPIISSGPGGIKGVYLCEQQRLKSPGGLFVSVLVAVLSMFSSIWAVYMWIISTLAKRSRGANTCLNHGDPSYHSLESLETAVVASESREEKAKWVEFMQLGYDLNRRRYERRPSFVADEIVLTSLPHAKHC